MPGRQITLSSSNNLSRLRTSRSEAGASLWSEALLQGSMNLICAGLLIASSVVHAQSTAGNTYQVNRGDPVLEVNGKFVDQKIAEFMEKNQLPGLTMAIVQAPYIPRVAGYGRANANNDELASEHTMFNIGPITQGFTATAVFQLVEAKKISLEAPISTYVKGLPSAWSAITVFELLQHSSGIPDFRSVADYAASTRYRPGELVALVKDKPLLFESGTRVAMSATDFVLLGLAIQNVSGMSYYQYIWDNQIKRIGLKNTMFSEDLAKGSKVDRPMPVAGENQHQKFKSDAQYIDPVEAATGYRRGKGSVEAVDETAPENLFAYGDLWSSAGDISTWDIALAGSVLVAKPEDRAMIYGPSKLKDGSTVRAMAGWEFTYQPGFDEIKGSSPGFSSYLSRFTLASDLVCVTLLTNKEGVDLTGLARDIATAYKLDLGPGVDSHKLITVESKFPVTETVARLKSRLDSAGVPVFATFDHAANASGAGLELRPTQVIVFGNPKVGTKLMVEHQPVAIDLPLRVEVWQDSQSRVWVGYHSMDQVADDYGIEDPNTTGAIANMMAKLVEGATDVYTY